MKFIKFLLLILAILVLFPLTSVMSNPSTAQDDENSCTDVVQVALETTETLCQGINRHEACYGNVLVDAEIDQDNETYSFNTPGDSINVASLRSLRLSPLNIDENRWGVVEMKLQANIPNSQPENVTLVAFGDVSLENASISSSTTLDVSVGQETISVYAEPWALAVIVDEFSSGQNIIAQGRSEDGQWLQVQLENSNVGWIEAAGIENDTDVDTLEIVDSQTATQSPMQAFYFESGIEDGCSEFPTNGMLIQTPEGVGQVNLLINEVDIQLGSTAFIQSQSGGIMEFTLLEGHARIESDSMSYELIPGSMTTIPMGPDMQAIGPPSEPVPYSTEGMENLPLQILDREFEIVPPPSAEEVTEGSRPAHSYDNNAADGNRPEDPGSQSQGQGGSPPENPGSQGQGGSPPEDPGSQSQGQGGSPPENPGGQGQGQGNN